MRLARVPGHRPGASDGKTSGSPEAVAAIQDAMTGRSEPSSGAPDPAAQAEDTVQPEDTVQAEDTVQPESAAASGAAAEPENTAAPAGDAEPGTAADAGAATGSGSRSRMRTALATAGRLPDLLVILSLVALLVIVFVNIICREVFGFSLLWEEEATQLCMTVLAFVGGAVCYRSDYLVSFNGCRDWLNARYRAHAHQTAFVAAFTLITAILLCYYGVQLASQNWPSATPILQFSTGWFDVVLAVGAGLLGLYALDRLVRAPWRVSLVAVPPALVLLGIEYALQRTGASSGADAALWTGLISLALFIALGIPIPVVFAAGAIIYIQDGAFGPLTSTPTAMSDELSNFILVAVPLFVLAGLLLTAGGLSRRLLAALELVLGRVRGGIGHSVVISMYLFSGISGSKLADVAAVGSAISEDSARLGIKRSDLAALLSASAVMGETVPPSVALLVAATTANVSVLAAFAAGILPAALIGILLMASVWRLAPRRTAPLAKHSAAEKAKLAAGAVPALAIATLLVGGLITGIASPSETSAVACIAAIIIALPLRDLSLRAIVSVTARTSQVVGMVLFLITTANAFAYGLTLGGVPLQVANALSSLKGIPWLFLLASIAVLPLIGLVLEGLPAILITVPLLIPVAQELHIDPILYVVVLVLCLGLGTFLPPLGIGLYTAARICDVEVSKVTRRLLGYMIPVGIGILVIAFIPQIALVIPRLLGLNP